MVRLEESQHYQHSTCPGKHPAGKGMGATPHGIAGQGPGCADAHEPVGLHPRHQEAQQDEEQAHSHQRHSCDRNGPSQVVPEHGHLDGREEDQHRIAERPPDPAVQQARLARVGVREEGKDGAEHRAQQRQEQRSEGPAHGAVGLAGHVPVRSDPGREMRQGPQAEGQRGKEQRVARHQSSHEWLLGGDGGKCAAGRPEGTALTAVHRPAHL
jgi:hypothetical protein